RGVRTDPDASAGRRGVRRPGRAVRRRDEPLVSASPIISGTKTAEPKLEHSIGAEVGLTEAECERVRELVGREPNHLEWAMFGAMWSEHCAYKHSRTLLRRLPSTGARVALGPGENAGAVDIGGGLLCVFKVE